MFQPLHLTRHAATRRQQRAITPFIADLLLQFGSTMRHDGAETAYFDKASRKFVRGYVGEQLFRQIEAKLDVYAVIGESGKIVTLAHRSKRLKRP